MSRSEAEEAEDDRHGCTPDTGMSHVGFRCPKSKE